MLEKGHIVMNKQPIKGNSDENPERKEQNCRESFSLLGEYLSNLEQNLGRNVDSVKAA